MRRRQFITRGPGAVAEVVGFRGIQPRASAVAEWGDRPEQLAELLVAPAEHDAPA